MKNARVANPKVLVAMSGGVDSSVAALLLKEAGYDLIGASMRLYNCAGVFDRSCCSAQDRVDAKLVCSKLNIPHVSLDYRSVFKKEVIDPFVAEYQSGRTPSPCILCNEHLKFEALFFDARRFGASKIATGHYARIEKGDDGHCRLMRAFNSTKDQSYFLFSLSREKLAGILFPLGELSKEQVRKIAEDNDLPVFQKPDSQEICFIPDGEVASFLETASPDKVKGNGNFVDKDGRILGRHRGIHTYTVGQRRGLGFGTGARQYVVKIDPIRNEVVLGPKGMLCKNKMIVKKVSWINAGGGDIKDADVKIRSTHIPAKAKICTVNNDEVEVLFEEAQTGIAPGQAAVFYKGDEVLGGGWIA